jgi:Zn-dependent peptidase ImmA (M78 family)
METVRVGGRKYSDPDVISLIRATGELVDPRSAVVNQARKLNGEYRSYGGDPANPLKRLEIMASISGLTLAPMNLERRKAEPRDAVLILNGKLHGNRGQILYNPQRPRGRVAFSIAHEIGHTFFPNTLTGARFRDICSDDSREANELERLCDLAASELLMPLEEFRDELKNLFTLAAVENIAEKFGSSFEATAFRLATAHPGIAIAGLLRYRLRRGEERSLTNSFNQSLFGNMEQVKGPAPEPRYRRQSFFCSPSCRDEHTIRWNKSFDPDSCVYLGGKPGDILRAVEALPNQNHQEGVLEVVRAPFQREDAHPEFPDLLFFWSASAPKHEVRSDVASSPMQASFF